MDQEKGSVLTSEYHSMMRSRQSAYEEYVQTLPEVERVFFSLR